MMIQINSKVKEVLEWVYCIVIALVLARSEERRVGKEC